VVVLSKLQSIHTNGKILSFLGKGSVKLRSLLASLSWEEGSYEKELDGLIKGRFSLLTNEI
jgi:hypothetical protein